MNKAEVKFLSNWDQRPCMDLPRKHVTAIGKQVKIDSTGTILLCVTLKCCMLSFLPGMPTRHVRNNLQSWILFCTEKIEILQMSSVASNIEASSRNKIICLVCWHEVNQYRTLELINSQYKKQIKILTKLICNQKDWALLHTRSWPQITLLFYSRWRG